MIWLHLTKESVMKNFIFCTVFNETHIPHMITDISTENDIGEHVEFKACVRYFCQIFIFSSNDSPSKTIKNIFYFI